MRCLTGGVRGLTVGGVRGLTAGGVHCLLVGGVYGLVCPAGLGEATCRGGRGCALGTGAGPQPVTYPPPFVRSRNTVNVHHHS